MKFPETKDVTWPYIRRSKDIHLTQDWFQKFLKGNADKCHLITSSKTPVGIEVANITIMSEEKIKLLGIHIDNRLSC